MFVSYEEMSWVKQRSHEENKITNKVIKKKCVVTNTVYLMLHDMRI